jgi:hypothetical protein
VDCGSAQIATLLAVGQLANPLLISGKEGAMSIIDRQRIAAANAMEAMGYTFDGFTWSEDASAEGSSALTAEAVALHSLLVLRADKLMGCAKGSDEEPEFKSIAETVMAYEAKRWRDGKVPGGKG